MSKTLLISGSPREGNTNFVLSQIKNKISNSELIRLRNENIKHCVGCLNCHKGDCVIDDDMTRIYQKLADSGLVILGTPNYFDNISGLLKDFIDRTNPLHRPEVLRDKKLILVTVGGGKPDGTKKYIDLAMHGFVRYQKMNLIGSYAFQALNPGDLKENNEALEKINQIVDESTSSQYPGK